MNTTKTTDLNKSITLEFHAAFERGERARGGRDRRVLSGNGVFAGDSLDSPRRLLLRSIAIRRAGNVFHNPMTVECGVRVASMPSPQRRAGSPGWIPEALFTGKQKLA